MSNAKLFVKGLRVTLGQGRLALRLWAANLLYSLLIVAPFALFLHRQASHSLSAREILARTDIHWLTDISRRFLEMTPPAMGLLLAGVVFFLLLTVFLNGGILGGLLRPQARPTLAGFCHDGGLYFWRFLRLALLSIPFYLFFAGALHGLLAALLRAVTRRAANEWPVLAANLLRLLALVLLVGIVSMFFDYVKIHLAASGRRSVLKEAWRTLKSMGRRFFKAWGLYLLAGLAFVALTLLYLEGARVLPAGTPLLVLAAFLWQQLYVLGRQFSRILFFASEVEFFKELGGEKN